MNGLIHRSKQQPYSITSSASGDTSSFKEAVTPTGNRRYGHQTRR
jgi:hypothetical protein